MIPLLYYQFRARRTSISFKLKTIYVTIRCDIKKIFHIEKMYDCVYIAGQKLRSLIKNVYCACVRACVCACI